MTSQKVSEVLLALEGKNNFESQKVLAQKFDIEIKTIEQTKPQQDDSVRVEMTFSKEQFAALKLAKSLLSHQCPEGQWSQVITLLAEKFSQSRLGKGAVASSNEDAMPANAAGGPQRYRPALPVEIKRQVFARAQHQCEFHNALTGVRCDSKFQLEIDHRKPLALGGGHDLGNLRVLCRSHNQRAWQQSLGRRSGNWVRNHSQDHSVKNATQFETF